MPPTTRRPDLPYDQREEDGGSLVFETDVLTERCEILGAPVVQLEVAASRPVAMVAARLSDVAPDGRATRVTYGLLNLTHRDVARGAGAAGARRALPGGRAAERGGAGLPGRAPDPAVTVHFVLAAGVAAAGAGAAVRAHRAAAHSSCRCGRWPSPTRSRCARSTSRKAPRPLATTRLSPGEYRWDVTRDMIAYESALDIVKDTGTIRYEDTGMEIGKQVHERYSWTADDFASVPRRNRMGHDLRQRRLVHPDRDPPGS